MTEKKKDHRSHGHSSKSKRPGRPRLELTHEQVFKLAKLGLTDTEMCSLLEISRSTLNNFRTTIQEGRAQLSKSIKRTQLELALDDRDKTMLIWVGKQYADQREKSHAIQENVESVIEADASEVARAEAFEAERDKVDLS